MPAVLLVFLAATIIVAPWLFEGFDVASCWMPWSVASHGLAPWRAYDGNTCNYPPLALYCLALSEALRLALHVPAQGALHVALIKLPFGLSYLAGAVPAARAGSPWLRWALPLAPPLAINAFVWGQADALLGVLLAAGVLAWTRARGPAGAAWFGLALALKLQAVVVFPVAAVYGLKRFGLRRSAGLWALTLAVVVLLALPFLLNGYAWSVLGAYVSGVDAYPAIERNAFNTWFLVDLPFRFAGWGLKDSLAVLGPLTPKWLGLAALTAYVAVALRALWREPERFELAAAQVALAFCMLPTQIHERYFVPAVALWALAADGLPGARPIFWGLCATASLNQLLVMGFDPGGAYPALPPAVILALGGLLALANVYLFVQGSRLQLTAASAP